MKKAPNPGLRNIDRERDKEKQHDDTMLEVFNYSNIEIIEMIFHKLDVNDHM